MAKQDRHPTIEQLSAYLDGQLSSGELSECDAHVETCQQCQRTLAELRETVALLHALPEPTLPRSFILPADMAVGRLAPVQPLPPASLHATPRRRAWPSYVRGIVRTVSTIAAVIGIVFFLSGLIGIAPAGGGAITASGSVQTHAPTAGQQDEASTPSRYAQSRSATPGTPMPTPGATPANEYTKSPPKGPHPTVQQTNWPNPLQFLLQVFDVSTPGGRVLLGSVLLIVGLAGFVFFRRL